MHALKTISLLLMIISMLIYSFFGCALRLRQLYITYEMTERMEQQNLTIIRHLTENQYKWTNEGKEMRIEGRLFDVKEFVGHDDGTIDVKGLFDEKEEELLGRIIKETNAGSSTGLKKIFSFYFQQVLSCSESTFVPSNDFIALSNRLPVHYQQRLPSVITDIITPPPQIRYSFLF